jgi:hypothetical protein
MEAQTYEQFMSKIKRKTPFPAKLRPKPTSPRRRYTKETPGTNAVYSQLYQARREAKKKGLYTSHSVKLWIYAYDDAILYDKDGQIFKFNLRELKLPSNAIQANLNFNQFLNVLYTANHVTPNIEFIWGEYWLIISGKTSKTTFEVKLPCVIQ